MAISVFITLCFLFLVYTDYRKSKWVIILNPFLLVIVWIYCYLVLPSFFVHEINHYYHWGINDSDINYSNILTLFLFLPLFLLYFYSPSYKIQDYNVITPFIKAGRGINIIWWLILLYVLYVLYVTLNSRSVTEYFIYDFTQNDKYKLKNIAYLFISISIYMYLATHKKYVFIPNVILIFIDLLHGSRTIAMIAIVPIIISLVCKNKKLYLIQLFAIFLLLLFIGVFRLSGDVIETDIPWYIRAIGEFRETYITLPLLITNHQFVGQADFLNMLANLFTGILQPLRDELSSSFMTAGTAISLYVGRGYGLASNFIISSLYYGYWFFLFSLIFLCLLTLAFYQLMIRIKYDSKIILTCFIVVFFRLIAREGIYSSIGLMLFVCTFYWFPFYFLKNNTILKRVEINDR